MTNHNLYSGFHALLFFMHYLSHCQQWQILIWDVSTIQSDDGRCLTLLLLQVSYLVSITSGIRKVSMEKVGTETVVLIELHKMLASSFTPASEHPFSPVSFHCFNLSKLAHFLPSCLHFCFARGKVKDHVPSTKTPSLDPQYTGRTSEICVCINFTSV